MINATSELVAAAGDLAMRYEQFIPDSFRTWLHERRVESDSRRTPDGYFAVAEVPAAVFDQWTAEGVDVNRLSAREIVARLRKEGLDEFILTGRRV